MNTTENTKTMPVSFEEATGPIDVTLKNDMMFHLVMAKSPKALKGLVCALKGLDPKTVKEVILTNPVDYSMYATKAIILDVKVLLNNDEIIDIELQMYINDEWELRSLLYMCRSFDSIGKGDDYLRLKPTTFIAIMNDPLFPDYPEFYSHYELLNTKNFQPYSSYLKLNVLYLNQTEIATQEDIDNGLVYWAKLFKTTKWEELKDLCSNNDAFKEVAQVMYSSNVQSQEKTIMEAHEKYMLDKRTLEHLLQIRTEENASLTAENSTLTAENSKLLALLKQNGVSDEQIASYLNK
jgi:predicted transposase/invertase (TIGR01784 family)